MSREVQSTDVFAAAVPVEVDPLDNATFPDLIKLLNEIAFDYVGRQWLGAHLRPQAIRDMRSDWMITKEPAEIDSFQPAHDCAECAAGNEKARQFLRANPGRYVALANLHYIEVWAS